MQQPIFKPSDYIRNLIAQGEGEELDFKFAINDSRKIARSIAAFANTKGGTLLIGVRDNGSIAGVRSEEELHMVDTAVLLYCSEPVVLYKQIYRLEGKDVLEVKIEYQERKRLVAVKEEDGRERVYIRIGDENQIVNSVWLKVWAKKNKPFNQQIDFTEKELFFIRQFQNSGRHTLHHLTKLTHLHKKVVEELLVKFILFDLLEMTFEKNGIFYHEKT
jgi:predicted HTH transcriptional regulator